MTTMKVMRLPGRFAALVVLMTGLSAVAVQVAAAGPGSEGGPAPAAGWVPLVESLADHPEVLTKDWAAVRAALPAGCFRDESNGSVACPPMEGVTRISVTPGPLGMIHVILKGPATCEAVYELLSQRFGKGELENGDRCYADWKLGKRVKRGTVSLSPGRKDPSQLHVQFAIEQGP